MASRRAGWALAAEAQVRAARTEDAEATAVLLGELGYPATPDQMRGRLERLARDGSSPVLVAVLAEVVVGIIALHVLPLLHHERDLCRITALVVAEARRGRGVGQSLVAAAERLARERGCARIEVTSNPRRQGAHAFYRGLGYDETPTRFLKVL